MRILFTRPGKRKVDMELPHDSNGDLDWNTLGKILTAHILGEVWPALIRNSNLAIELHCIRSVLSATGVAK
jgi:hypothetical protein